MFKLFDSSFYARNGAALGGLAAGTMVMLFAGAFGSVVITGKGLSDGPSQGEQAYIIEE